MGTGRPSLPRSSPGPHARAPSASSANLSVSPHGSAAGSTGTAPATLSTRGPAVSSRHLLTEQRAGLSFPGSLATCQVLFELSQSHPHPRLERHAPQQPSPFLPRPLHGWPLNPHPSAEVREHVTSSRKAFWASLPGVVGSLRHPRGCLSLLCLLCPHFRGSPLSKHLHAHLP